MLSKSSVNFERQVIHYSGFCVKNNLEFCIISTPLLCSCHLKLVFLLYDNKLLWVLISLHVSLSQIAACPEIFAAKE